MRQCGTVLVPDRVPSCRFSHDQPDSRPARESKMTCEFVSRLSIRVQPRMLALPKLPLGLEIAPFFF